MATASFRFGALEEPLITAVLNKLLVEPNFWIITKNDMNKI